MPLGMYVGTELARVSNRYFLLGIVSSSLVGDSRHSGEPVYPGLRVDGLPLEPAVIALKWLERFLGMEKVLGSNPSYGSNGFRKLTRGSRMLTHLPHRLSWAYLLTCLRGVKVAAPDLESGVLVTCRFESDRGYAN